MDGLPTPPNEELVKSHGLKKAHANSKSVKTVHRTLKRTGTHAHPPSPSQDSHSQHSDGRHKRVWKACERCRMKKTKCDGEFPCKRCKDDGLVCTAGTRKKTEYKQLPRGYAEVLENTQFALIATVHKLYSMVRNQQQWDLGEPELNDRGQPVIHNIASKLGCIRPNSDVDLPGHSIFPEDEAGLSELARQLEEQQQKDACVTAVSPQTQHLNQETDSTTSSYNRACSSPASDFDHSDLDLDHDYRAAAFGGGSASAITMSPASLSYGPDFDIDIPPPLSATHSDGFHSPIIPSPHYTNQPWLHNTHERTVGEYNQQQRQQQQQQGFLPSNGAASYMEMDILNQGLMESSYGTIKPHVLSCPNPEVMMGVGDPMIYGGFDPDALRM